MTKYGRSPWIDQFPKSRVPALPRQRGPLKSDVVIIGGGLTGCATAYAFAVAGVKVVLVEAAQIGRGNSGSSAGLDLGRPGHRVRGSRKGARPARRPARVARLAARRARLRRPAPAARREVLSRRAAGSDRRRHARPGWRASRASSRRGAKPASTRRSSRRPRSEASSDWTRQQGCARKTARRSIRIAPASGSPRRRRSAAPRSSSAHR